MNATSHESPATASVHVDVLEFDGIVAVAQAVPLRYLGLGVAGGIGRAGAQGVTANRDRPPYERPVLPVVGPSRRLELGWVPLTFAGETDVDPRDRAGARPSLAAHPVGAGLNG